MDWKEISNLSLYTDAEMERAQRDNIAINSPPVEHTQLPREILARLQPHYSDWSLQDKAVNHRELRASDTVKLFQKDGKDWVSVNAFGTGVVLGKTAYALSRRSLRKPSNKGGGQGAGYEAGAFSAAAQQPEESLVPTVRITTPKDGDKIDINKSKQLQNDVTTHTINEGESVADFTQRVTGKANPDAVYNFNNGRVTQNNPPVGGDELRVLNGKKLKVDGTVSNSQSVTLSWSGGSESIDIGKSSPNSTKGWDTSIPAKPGDYTLTAKAGGASHSVKVSLIEMFDMVVELEFKHNTVIEDEIEKLALPIDAKVTGSETKQHQSDSAKSQFEIPELPNGDYKLELAIYNLEQRSMK